LPFPGILDQQSRDVYILYMAEKGNFERLVASLSLNERQSLLEKLKGQSKISSELLYARENESVPAIDTETEYANLPWYFHLWYLIMSFFRAKPPVKIFEDHQVAILGNKIEERSPGLYNYQKDMLLPAFHRQMIKLKEAARFFYSALDTSVNRDKGAFFSFLGSLEMIDVHDRLQTETDPHFIVERNPDTPEMDMRQIAFKSMDDALSMVTEEYRNVMYSNARNLNCLKELSSFLFDRVIMAFEHNAYVSGETCTASLVRELLATLNNILLSLVRVPPMTLLESLFVFILQDRAEEAGFDIGREMRGLLIKAEESLEIIREFNKQVPLTWIIRCSSRRMAYSPKQVSGGEDWFIVYRDFWKRRIESLFSEFMKDRRHRELLNAFRYFLKGNSLKVLGNIKSEANPDGLPVRGAFALSFLMTFYSVVFMPDINKILRTILIDGEFQRKENRAEFAEAYNNLIKLEDDIKKFELEISPIGDYGKRYAHARQDMSMLSVRRRKIQLVLDETSQYAEKIQAQVRDAGRSMVNILSGVLGKDTRGRYDGLANLTQLAGKGSTFLSGVEETIALFQKFIMLMDDIEAMENGR